MDIATKKTDFNEAENRFELKIDDYLAKIDVKSGSKGVYFLHTEVPDQLSNKGVGHKIVREALEWIERKELLVIPICPFVRSYISANIEEYRKVLSEAAKL